MKFLQLPRPFYINSYAGKHIIYSFEKKLWMDGGSPVPRVFQEFMEREWKRQQREQREPRREPRQPRQTRQEDPLKRSFNPFQK